MTRWYARVEYDAPDPVQAPTALTMALDGGDHWQTPDGRLALSFHVDTSTLRAATEEALRLARAAMKRADVTGEAATLTVEPGDTRDT